MTEGSGDEVVCVECGYETLVFSDEDQVCPHCEYEEHDEVRDLATQKVDRILNSHGPTLRPKDRVDDVILEGLQSDG